MTCTVEVVYMDFIQDDDGKYDRNAIGQARTTTFHYKPHHGEGGDELIQLILFCMEGIYQFGDTPITFLGLTAADSIPTSEVDLVPDLLCYRASESPYAKVEHCRMRTGPRPFAGVTRCIALDTRMLWQKGPLEADLQTEKAKSWKRGDPYAMYPHCPLLFNERLPWTEMWNSSGLSADTGEAQA
jgi:hypothetical protein